LEYKIDHLSELPQNKDIKIGCIGAGFIMADCHLVAYRKAGLNPVAISSRSVETAKKVAARHQIETVYATYQELLADQSIEVVDIAVPPDVQLGVVEQAVKHADHIRGILAQKPLGINYAQAQRIVRLCEEAGITLVVNQNMRYDHSIRGAKSLLDQGAFGQPVTATIDMRAIPHWMPWQQRQGWVTLRIMSIHHLDTFRYWLGNPDRVMASVRSDPRTDKQFAHTDGICMYILEYDNGPRASAWDDVWAGPANEGAAADNRINWRLEGTTGMARGTIGWPSYPERTPSTLDYTTIELGDRWIKPRWDEVWFPDAFIGPMSELLIALETGNAPQMSGKENLGTMALVDACYLSAKEHRSVSLNEIIESHSN
jgi:predicted dehydrogenase